MLEEFRVRRGFTRGASVGLPREGSRKGKEGGRGGKNNTPDSGGGVRLLMWPYMANLPTVASRVRSHGNIAWKRKKFSYNRRLEVHPKTTIQPGGDDV